MDDCTFENNRSDKASILFVTYTLGGGGAERAMLRFANALSERGHNVWVYCYERLDCEYTVSPSVNVIYSSASRLNGRDGKLKKYFVDALAVRKLAQVNEFDYVIPFCTEMVICSYFGLICTGTTVIATERNNPIDGCKERLKRALRDYVYKRCSAVWVQNSSQMAFYQDLCDCPVFVIPNIVEMTPKNLDTSENIKSFMTAGRLFPQKNHSMMIEAFVSAHEKNPDISLDIYGAGPLENELGQLIVDLDAREYVWLRGHSSDVYAELQRHDAFCFTSDYEGLPNALIEAMLVGLPVVTTDFETGSHELVDDGVTGHIVHCGDVDAFAAAVEDVVANPARAYAMAAKARELLEPRFAEERLVNLFLEECGAV